MNIQQTLPGGKPLCSCFLVLFLLSTIFLPGSAQCNPANKHVLIVHSYHQEFPWTDSIMAGMMEVLHREHPKADIHVEYLDAKRLAPDRTSKAFKELLRLKFEKKSPDVIVVSDDAAFQTILALRPSLFPDVPLVFCGVNELTDAMIAGMTGITGVVEDFDLRGTLEIALHLHPRSKHVAVISDSTETGRINLERYRQVRPAFADRFESIELAEMSAEELTRRLGQLPNDTVLLLLSFYRDRNGRSFSVPDMMHLIAQASDLPIYVAWDYMLIPRALGGRVVSGRQQGESAARMAALILQGTPVASLPIQRVSPNIPMFDQIELTRFGIDSARLPKGSVVINAPPSLPSRYLWFIAGFSVLVLAEGLLILALIRNTRRYKTSQEDLRQSEERFALAMQAASDGIFDWDLKTNRVYYSPAWKHMLGYRDDELENDFSVWERLTEPDDLVRAWALQRELLAGKRDRFDMEFRMRHKEGHWVDILARATTILAADGTPAREVGTHVDITERKQAEKALAAHERKYRDLFEANQDGISLFRINPDGTPAPFLDVNEAAAAMVGYSKHELAGMTPMDVEPAVSPESIAQRLATLAATGQARFETVLVAKDRREISVEVLVRSIVYEGAPALMNIVRDISERKQAEELLRDSLAEKEVLLREVHHRVKNNLAAIIGLFDLQRQAMDDPRTLAVLTDLSSRIRSMSLVHEKLYRSDSLASIDFHDYLHSLISHLRTSFGTPRIRCDIAAQGVRMPLDLAVPCGMIINELVTNALKYAFPENRAQPEDSDCRIHIALGRDDNTFTLSVADNGIGLAADFDWRTAKTLGLLLVRMLGQHQLGGRWEVDLRQGTSFILTFALRNGNHANA